MLAYSRGMHVRGEEYCDARHDWLGLGPKFWQ